MKTLSSRTLSSMSEIIRVGGWALRGAGLPFGVAERATRLLAYTEAVHGGAVRDICHHEAIIAPAAAAKGLGHSRGADGGWIVDGGGRHLIEAGPPVVDLATSDARRHGVGHARLAPVAGFVFVTALADLMTRRSLSGVCVYRAGASDRLPPSMPPSGWILFGQRDGQALFATGRPGEGPCRRIGEIMAATPFAPALAAGLAEAASGGEGFLSITAFGVGDATGGRLVECLAGEDAAPTLRDHAGRFAEAYRDGVEMEERDLKDLYALEVRTWAPTSERSRSQAGYGKF